MSYKKIWDIFKNEAYKKGFIKKIVGDNAFQNCKGEIFRLKSSNDNKIKIWNEKDNKYVIIDY